MLWEARSLRITRARWRACRSPRSNGTPNSVYGRIALSTKRWLEANSEDEHSPGSFGLGYQNHEDIYRRSHLRAVALARFF